MAKIIAVLSIITDLDLKTENQGDWFLFHSSILLHIIPPPLLPPYYIIKEPHDNGSIKTGTSPCGSYGSIVRMRQYN